MAMTKRSLERIAAELLEVKPDPNLEPKSLNEALYTGWLMAVEAVADAADADMGLDVNGNRRFKLGSVHAGQRGQGMNGLHDADQVVGRIRKDGGWDRRYRVYQALPESEQEVSPMRQAIIITIGVIVYGILAMAVGLLLLAAAAATT